MGRKDREMLTHMSPVDWISILPKTGPQANPAIMNPIALEKDITLLPSGVMSDR